MSLTYQIILDGATLPDNSSIVLAAKYFDWVCLKCTQSNNIYYFLLLLIHLLSASIIKHFKGAIQ